MFIQPLAKRFSYAIKIVFVSLLIGLFSIQAQAAPVQQSPITASGWEALDFSCDSVTEIPVLECTVLVRLYSTTDGPNWTANTDWLETLTPCSWFGVECSGGHVTRVLLSDNHLVGSIPLGLGQLSNLTVLHLSRNELTGQIPADLGNLSNMVVAYLNNNQFTGQIPDSLGNLENLTTLYLGVNQLEGPIPPELGNLTELVTLELRYNQLSGEIPSSFDNLDNLHILSLRSNNLTGEIPVALGGMSQLASLDLGQNLLEGSIPSEFGSLSNLRQLAVFGNPSLTGVLPETLSNLSLDLFYFDDTSLCESDSANFQTWLGLIGDLRQTGIICHSPTSISLSSTTVEEFQELGTDVGTFSTTDPDVGDVFTYSFAEGSGDADNSSFSIFADHLKTAEYFDASVKNQYTIRVRVTDTSGAFTEQVFQIDILPLVSCGSVGQDPCSWDGGGDGVSWHDPFNWELDYVPSQDATILLDTADEVRVNEDFLFDGMLTITSNTNLIVGENVILTIDANAIIQNDGNIENLGSIENYGLITDSTINFGATILNFGTFTNHNEISIHYTTNYGTVIVDAGAVYNVMWYFVNQNTLIINSGASMPFYQLLNYGGNIYNYGALENYGLLHNGGWLFENYGTIENIEGLFINDAVFYNSGAINHTDLSNSANFVNDCTGTDDFLVTGNPIVDVCDGIDYSVDTDPYSLSNDFSDLALGGSTYGSITDRGDQNLTVYDDAVGGVLISADLSGVAPAILSTCGAISDLILTAGDQVLVTCGSVSIDVIAGEVDIIFYASNGSQATASIGVGNSITFEPGTITFEVPEANVSTIVVLVDGNEVPLEGGATVELPSVSEVAAPVDPTLVNTEITFGANFTDADETDTHTAMWSWGDGTESVGVVWEGSISGSHAYSTPGVYTITLTVTDSDGGVGSSSFRYIVIYDPDGGFVTGGGWLESPEGAFVSDPTLDGKATFGFVSRYRRGTFTPTGTTQFQFQVADLSFHSTTYEWLVVTGNNYARFKGSGTINGMGDFKFMIWAGDGEPDTFRIRIWEEDEFGNETMIYDNGFDQEIGGGSIVVHD